MTRYLNWIGLCLLCSHSLYSQPDSWSHGELKWYTIRTEHFDVHYHDNPYSQISPIFKGPERTARVVAKIAEEVYEPITSLYHYKPERIHIIIRDTDDYSNGGAYYYDNKIEIWASSLDFELRGAHNWLRNVVTHEFTHMVSIQAMMKFSRKIPAFYLQYIGYEKERRQDVLRGFPNVIASYPVSGVSLPVWFAEGVAQYQQKNLQYEFWDSHRDMILRSRALSNQLLTLNQMSTFGKNSIGNESAYNSGYAFVSYLASRYGEEVLQKICAYASETLASFENAFKKAAGEPLDGVYRQWLSTIQIQYTANMQTVKTHLVEGDPVFQEGTGNFFPAYSPDGKKIAFISNKDFDYLSQTSLYVLDMETNALTKIAEHVEGPASWSPDGRSLIYSKNYFKNNFHSQINDLYLFDFGPSREFRLTRGLRAFSPLFSITGRSIIAVVNQDGSNNLIKISGIPHDLRSLEDLFDEQTFALKGLKVDRLTQFDDGRQVYKPVISPDGHKIIFDTSVDDGRDIAQIDLDSLEMTFLLKENFDERSPSLSADGRYLFYSCDKSGIYNIYRMDLSTKESALITNVEGGAFYPSFNSQNELVFSLYKNVGYTLATIRDPQPIEESAATYRPVNVNFVKQDISNHETASKEYPTRWATYPKSYDDRELGTFDSVKSYKTIFLDFSLLPVLRFDYGTVKTGLYFYSSDLLNKSSFFGGALVNFTEFDRDLFGIYEFSGFGPTAFLEIYNVTRSRTFRENADPTNDAFAVKYESIQKNTFELREFDGGFDFSILSPRDTRFNISHGEYFVKVSGKEYENGGYTLFPRTGAIKYFYGNDISLQWSHSTLRPFVDREINPRGGRKITSRYGYNFDHLLDGFAFNPANGSTPVIYKKSFFQRLEGTWSEFIKSPIADHTIEINFQGGIIPAKVDSFYNFFGGGLVGLKGYSYYSIEGSKLALLMANYRFPLMRNIDRRISILYLDKVFWAFYFGYGNAWSDKTTFHQLKDFKKDVGAELRMEFYSFYVYPTRLTFNAVYGLDKFTTYGPLISSIAPTGDIVKKPQRIVNGHEWKYYLTILFGFTLFD